MSDTVKCFVHEADALHHDDGTHRTTPRTTNGRDVSTFEARMDRHITDLTVEDPGPGNPFRVGDRADHWSGRLDPRPVVAVKRSRIRLQIGALVTDWIPANLYTRRGAA